MAAMNFSSRRIRFLRATCTSKDDKAAGESVAECGPVGRTDLTAAGLEARTFYESLISSTCSSADAEHAPSAPQGDFGRKQDTQAGRKTRKTPKQAVGRRKGSANVERQSNRVQTRNVSAFLRSAQEGDITAMTSYLESGAADINAVDCFNWTALMCASYSGQLDAVSFLLGKGALWDSQRDKCGNTARDLAKLAGHSAVVRALEAASYELAPTRQLHQRTEARLKDKKFWCSVCSVEITESSQRTHQSCTVHLFSCQHEPQSTRYYIPESNVGFQMMLRDGWDKEQGLGPDGAGLKFPVKTVLKQDRKGLGAVEKGEEAAKARVTHFRPYDVAAVKRPVPPKVRKLRPATLNKQARKKSGRREKNWERDYRQSFNLGV